MKTKLNHVNIDPYEFYIDPYALSTLLFIGMGKVEVKFPSKRKKTKKLNKEK